MTEYWRSMKLPKFKISKRRNCEVGEEIALSVVNGTQQIMLYDPFCYLCADGVIIPPRSCQQSIADGTIARSLPAIAGILKTRKEKFIIVEVKHKLFSDCITVKKLDG